VEKFVWLALCAALGVGPLGDNLLENGDVRGPAKWGKSAPDELASIDTDVGAAKKGSLRIRNLSPKERAPYNWNQRVELPKKLPARLKLSAQVRTEQIAPGADACVMIQIFSEPDKAIGYAWADHVTTDTDWRATKAVFDVPKEATYVRVLAYFAGGGTAWFDDLALEETDEAVTGQSMGGTAPDGPTETLVRGCAADLPWCFSGDQARTRAAKENKPILVYVRCTDAKAGLESARSSIEAPQIPLSDDGYAKDLLFRAGPLSSPEVRDLVARRTVPLCVTYVLGDNTYGGAAPPGWDHTTIPGNVTFTVDHEQGGEKRGSLRIDCPDPSSKVAHCWFQLFVAPSELPASATLRLRVRTAGMSERSEVGVLLDWFAKEERVRDLRTPELHANTDWKEQEISFDIPKNAEHAGLLAYLKGDGTAWFDDFSLEIKGERGKRVELLQSGAIEATEVKLEGFEIDPRDVTTPALILVDEHGKIERKLHRIGTLSDDLVDWWLREALKQSGAKSKARDAQDLYRDGELERVFALTKSPSNDDALALRALAQVRAGRLDDARKTLEHGKSASSEAALGTVCLRTGAWAEALEHFDAAAQGAQGDAQAQAKFWSAWCLEQLGRHDGARAIWKELVGPTTLGRRAAACMLDGGPRLSFGASTLLWPRTKDLPEQSERGEPGDVDLARSVVVLLEMQRADGSFGEQMGADGLGYEDGAITAIAVDALMHVDKKLPGALSATSAKVRERALEFLRRFARDDSQHPAAMQAFNDPYALRLFVQLGEKVPAESLIARIARAQLPDGNWTVYNAERPASFNTALAVMALQEAKSAGLAVPEATLANGIAALEKMRQPSGRFPYSTAPGHDWMTSEWGSIARDPLCEHVLLACGKSSRENLAGALQRYLKFNAELRVPTKRLYDYFNSRGHAGYYFFFAHRNALEAARAFAEPELVARVESAARDAVTSAMEGDGSFMDKFLLGRAYGTAMALLIVE
jgi:tetratricopeptide (TPR) repeat protein